MEMKQYVKIILSILILITLSSCSDFLEVVPDDTPSLEDAFSNRSVLEKFLFSCYNYLPDPTDPFYYPTIFSSRDEFDWGFAAVYNGPGPLIALGYQNTNSPLQDYWSGKNNGGKSMFNAIRQCNIFLENAHIPRDIDEEERCRWIAEVKFLKAYFHFFLLQLYGPIPIIKESLPVSASTEEVKVYREPLDECIDYIVDLINEAVPDLPFKLRNPSDEYGRITQPIALGIRAKVLVWAASPLMNGNPDFKNWVDSRGKHLMPQTYDHSKWEKAVNAIEIAIDTCHKAGHMLYKYNPATNPQSYNMSDKIVQTLTVRKSITDRWNRGIIWSSVNYFSSGKGGEANMSDMQRCCFPRMVGEDVNIAVQYYYANWRMSELFYTKNGVPIEEDKFFDYDNRLLPKTALPGDQHAEFIATGQTTATMHFNREPRFYGSLGFDRGFFEIATGTADGGASFSPYLRQRPGELVPSYIIGYLVKKIVAFETTGSENIAGKGYRPYNYYFPLLRLSDLYLLYSEALNEIKTEPDEEVYFWIDEVRRNQGIGGVVESWQSYSKYPDKPKSKDEMRKIIQQERFIELAFEGQRFWDVRRWKLAEELWTLPILKYGDSRVPEEYYVPYEYEEGRKFSFKDYFWPIRDYDIQVNPLLEQSYGW